MLRKTTFLFDFLRMPEMSDFRWQDDIYQIRFTYSLKI